MVSYSEVKLEEGGPPNLAWAVFLGKAEIWTQIQGEHHIKAKAEGRKCVYKLRKDMTACDSPATWKNCLLTALEGAKLIDAYILNL